MGCPCSNTGRFFKILLWQYFANCPFLVIYSDTCLEIFGTSNFSVVGKFVFVHPEKICCDGDALTPSVGVFRQSSKAS